MSDIDPRFHKMLEIANKIENIAQHSNPLTAPMLIRDFVVGLDIANDLLADAIKADLRAHASLKQAEAEAYFDRAPVYLKQKGVKESSEAKKTYIPIDPMVMANADRKAQTESLVTFLKNKLQILRCAHDDVKRMAYASEYTSSNYEGM